MSLNTAPQTVTAEEYARIFELERQQVYPMVDAFEAERGYAINRDVLEDMARVLSCPMKAVPPNWQHGRVIYSMARAYLRGKSTGYLTFLDLGTAKGFSAMCAQAALNDHVGCCVLGVITSVDVMPPMARVRRNTVAEVDSLKTLPEILEAWSWACGITFLESTGIDYLKRYTGQIHFAFIDGKHTDDAVFQEGQLLSKLQEPGDIAIFDDVHIPGVGEAVKKLGKHYGLEYLEVLPKRKYAIGVRK